MELVKLDHEYRKNVLNCVLTHFTFEKKITLHLMYIKGKIFKIELSGTGHLFMIYFMFCL
jgi:hypothetical protein